jgi:ABC-type oligopeptide transport system substrate-binding subunit
MRAPLRLLFRTGLATLVATSILLMGRIPSSAHPATKALSILRLDYYVLPATGSGTPSWSLDPVLDTRYGEQNTLALVQANLVRLLPSGKPASDLATWKASKNDLVYTFTIRRNARFSNGHDVTAQDAAFSLERALAPSTNSPVAKGYLGLIRGASDYSAGKTKTLSGVKVLGRRTLQITITRPVAYFLAELAYSTADVLDPSVVAGKPIGGPRDYLTNTCRANQGAGPFRFVCHDGSSTPHSFYSGHTPRYTLVPNPYYYGRKPHVEISLPQSQPTALASYKLYLLGKLDTSALPAPYLNRWKGTKEYRPAPSSRVTYLIPNTQSPPFDNLHCRLAVAYAVDRTTLAEKILGGTERATYAVVPSGMLGYYAGKDNPHYSTSRARAELASCPGRTAPFSFKYVSGIEGEAVANNLAAAGLNVRPTPLSGDDWLKVVSRPLDKTNTQLVTSAWTEDYPDPQDYCTILLHSGQPYNVGGWHNATYDRLVDRAELTLKRNERAQLYIQAQHIALGQGGFISLTNAIRPGLLKPYVHGMVGSEWTEGFLPRDGDWANVTISKH